jgi:hypothetical protein
MVRGLFIIIILLSHCSFIIANHVSPNIIRDNSLWIGYFSHVKLKEKWAINSDFQYRTRNGISQSSQLLFRSGLSYSFNNKLEVTLGGAHFRFFITDDITRGEWRPWQEVKISDQIGIIKISNRFRFEQRFNEIVKDGSPSGNYLFNWRFRHRIDLRVPLKKEKDNGNNLHALLGNELMINAGENIQINYFDQNRLYIGLNYEINKQMSVQLQYMHLWQLSSFAREMNFTNILRFNFYHTISI